MVAISCEEFMLGILATLAQRRWLVVSLDKDRFDAAIEASFNLLVEMAPERGIRLNFYVMCHPTYGDSTVVRDGLARLAQWSLISFDGPTYQTVRLQMTPEFAARMMDRMGLDPDLFGPITDRFEAIFRP